MPVYLFRVVRRGRATHMFAHSRDIYPWLERVLARATAVDCTAPHCAVPPDFDWAATDYDPSLRTCADGYAAIAADVLDMLQDDTTLFGTPQAWDRCVDVVVSTAMLAAIRETH